MPRTKAHENTPCNGCGTDIREGDECVIDQCSEPAEYYCLKCGL